MNGSVFGRKGVRTVIIPVIVFALLILIQIVYIILLLRHDLASNFTVAMLSGICALVFNTVLNILFIKYTAFINELYEREKENELKSNLEHLDKKYFDTMEKEISDSRQMKENILIKINALKHNLENGELNKNQGIVSEVEDDVAIVDKNRYCEEPVIDMVLTLKSRKAYSCDIPITIKAVVPSDIGISKLDLSSAISNMADNALEAAIVFQEAGNPSYVNISICRKGDYLVIRTENPTVSDGKISDIGEMHTTKNNNYGIHGLGLKILERIACRYNGELTVDIKDHMCVFNMLLDCSMRR